MTLRLWPAGPLALLTFVFTVAIGQAAPLPVLDDKPLLQVDPGGPSAAVTALAFSPDGDTLYVAGFDKVVRVWQRRDGRFELTRTLHVPIGPGTAGYVNAIAISDDGKWLAMAGRAPMRGETGFQRIGVMVEAAAITPEKLEDAGAIYVMPTDKPADGKVLRGHRGEVRALAFAPARAGQPQLLVSSATERMGTRKYGGVHLWNVETGKVVAERNDLPERVEPPPGLAVWYTDTKPAEVRVAIAWPQAKGQDKVDLRIWNPKAKLDEAMAVRKADRYTRPLALLSSGAEPRVLAGGLSIESGRLQVWSLGDKPSAPTTVVTFASNGQVHYVPDALVPVSAKGNGNLDYAAAILRPTVDEDNQLALIDLENKREVARLPLKNSERINLPLLAAAPKGGFLAVADNADHSVQLFAVTDLLRLGARATPSQVLRSNGLTARRVAFVDKGRGLWLSDDARAKVLEGGLYFDFEKPLLQFSEGKALTIDRPALGDWSMDVDDDLHTVRVSHGDKNYEPLVLQKREVVTALALRPPDATAPAFAAVAYTDRDNVRTLIGLYRLEEDGKTARLVPFRLLIAHLQDVKHLTFSKSRPLLASVAEDQTVCVWGLTDLDNAVGQIAGLGLASDAGQAVVHSVEKGSAAAKAGLEPDDVLEEFGTPGGKMKPVKTAGDFLLAVSTRRPGAEIEVKIKGKDKPLTVTVGRGVEGWKPLFTLFLQRNQAGLGWVGWSPFGPYDASSDAAEACVGWHTNTGNPKTPVDFVPVGAHRKEYYKHGILSLLAQEADLSRALKRFEASLIPPAPALHIASPDGGRVADKGDVVLIRTAVPALQVGINADYALTDASVLKWVVSRTDGGNVTTAAAEASGTYQTAFINSVHLGKVNAAMAEATGTAKRRDDGWELDLSTVQWARGDYEVRVSLHPDATGAAVATRSMKLRFQPPAPKLVVQINGKDAVTSAEKPLEVMDEKAALTLLVSATPPRKVDLSYVQAVNNKEKAADKLQTVEAGKDAVRVEKEFTLSKGVNHFVLRAVNEGALPRHESEETTTADVYLKFQAPVELPPIITVSKPERTEVRTFANSTAWVVDRPQVRLPVSVAAAGVLVQADWARGAAEPTSVLPAAGAGKVLEFSVDLELKADEIVPLRFRTKSKNSDESIDELTIVYRPALPVLAVNALPSPDFLDPKVTLTGTYLAATPEPFEIVVRVTPELGSSRDTKEFKAELDAERKAWQAPLTQPPGRNKIEVFARNQWRGEPGASVTLNLRYRRPPRIVEAKPVTALETAVLEKLPLKVDSPVGMPLRYLTIDGHRYYTFTATPGAQNAGWVTWQVEVPNVPVADGGRKLEQLHVLAYNDDGPYGNEPLLKPTIITVTHMKLPPKPADITSTIGDQYTAKQPRFELPLRILSDSKLKMAEIWRGKEMLHKIDLTKLQQEGKSFVLEETANLLLKYGTNALDVVVINDGGRSVKPMVVNVEPPAVRVEIEELQERDAKGVPTVIKGKAPGFLVWVVGKVIWSDPDAPEIDAKNLSVIAMVRGCKQFPVQLDPRAGKTSNFRRFEVPVVLTKDTNDIQIEVKKGRIDAAPAVAQTVLTENKFTLACTKPAKEQRLHLLIVGVDVTDGKALTTRVLNMLSVKAEDRPPGLQGDFKTAAFDRCILYQLLIDEVDRGKVEAQLEAINKEIDRLRRETKVLNDVVLIYYQGQDKLINGELWLKTSLNLQYPDVDVEAYGIPCHSLPRAAGAELLLLNVVGAPTGQAQGGPGHGVDRDTAYIRYFRRPDDAKNEMLDGLQKALQKKSLLGEVAVLVIEAWAAIPGGPKATVAAGPLADRDFSGKK